MSLEQAVNIKEALVVVRWLLSNTIESLYDRVF